MKNIYKNTARIAGFLLMLLAALAGLTRLLEVKNYRLNRVGLFEREMNYEVLFLGTSIMHNTIAPMELWKNHGISSFNMGAPNCTLAENSALLPEILRYCDPKLVVIDVYGLSAYNTGNGKYKTKEVHQQHDPFDILPLTPGKIRAVEDIFDDYPWRTEFYWNFILYHDRWKDLKKNDFFPVASHEKGGSQVLGWKPKVVPLPVADMPDTELPNSPCRHYLERLLDDCEARGLPVLCVDIPHGCSVEELEEALLVEKMTDTRPNCEFLSLFDRSLVNSRTDFFTDGAHLNCSGSFKVTDYLGAYLREHYDLGDFSGDPLWQRDYGEWHRQKVSRLQLTRKLTFLLLLLSDPEFAGELTIFDGALAARPELSELTENAAVPFRYVENQKSEDGACAALTIRDLTTGEELREVRFFYGEDPKALMEIRAGQPSSEG